MKNCVAFAILVLCVASAHGIVWKDCGSKRSKVKDVLVTGCEKSKVCALPRGRNVTFTVDFTTNAGADGAKSVVHGIIDRIPLPFPIAHPDACTDKSCGLTCPLKASKSYSFHQNIYVHSAYPKVKAVVKWELQNKESEDIFCVMVAAQITDAKKKDLNRTKLRYANHTPKLFQLL